jgi:mersacidin/lichenicidin family type 2 lantibiotic
MTKLDIIRAWKDEEYRRGLSDSDRALLPQNPAGIVVLSDSELTDVEGGGDGGCVTLTITFPFCDTKMFTASCDTVCPMTLSDG